MGVGETAQLIQPRNKCKEKTEGSADLKDIFTTATQFMKPEDMTTQFWFGLVLRRIFFKRHIHTHKSQNLRNTFSLEKKKLKRTMLRTEPTTLAHREMTTFARL